MRAVYRVSGESNNEQAEQRAALLSQFPELAELHRLIEQNPAATGARSRLASAYLDHQLHWAAYELLTNVPPMALDDSNTNLQLARVWDVWGQYDLALKHAERAIALGAASAHAYEVLGRIYLHRNEPAEAALYYKRAAQQDDNAAVLANLGYVYILLSDWENARTALEKSIELDSAIPEAHNNLAVVLTKLGDEKGALLHLSTTAEPFVALNNMGVLYWREQKIERAREFFEAALDVAPDYEIAQRNLQALQTLMAPPPLTPPFHN
jgi:tetratricopeptide (TPR) repeat protein